MGGQLQKAVVCKRNGHTARVAPVGLDPYHSATQRHACSRCTFPSGKVHNQKQLRAWIYRLGQHQMQAATADVIEYRLERECRRVRVDAADEDGKGHFETQCTAALPARGGHHHDSAGGEAVLIRPPPCLGLHSRMLRGLNHLHHCIDSRVHTTPAVPAYGGREQP